MKFILIEETTKTDSTKRQPEIERREEIVTEVRKVGKDVFLVAVNQSFADSGLDKTVGTVTTSTRHYVTCAELGLQRRETLVTYGGAKDGFQIYRLQL